MLWKAAREGDAAILSVLCRRGARVNSTNPNPASKFKFPFNFEGWSAMHFAASYGHTACIKKLLKLKGDVSARTYRFGWTPLHYAAHDGHDDACEALLLGGANVSAQTKRDGQTALHLAAMNVSGYSTRTHVRTHANRNIAKLD